MYWNELLDKLIFFCLKIHLNFSLSKSQSIKKNIKSNFRDYFTKIEVWVEINFLSGLNCSFSLP